MVAAENTPQVLHAACQIWPHHTRSALDALRTFDRSPGPDLVAGLAVNTDLAEAESAKLLAEVWSHEARIMSVDDGVATARQILTRQPKGTEEEPVLALRLWIEAREDYQAHLLQTLLASSDLNDGQHKRVWLQALGASRDLGQNFFLSVLPKVLGLMGMPETDRAILDNAEILTDLFTSQAEKNALSRVLLEGLAASSSTGTKNRIADWMKNIGGGTALRRLGSGVELAHDDILILTPRFPRSTPLRQYKKRQES